MIGYRIDTAKKFFFDAAAVEDAAERAEVRALGWYGARVRKAAKWSIRPAGKAQQGRDAQGRFTKKAAPASKPGDPPKSHTGILRRFIYYTWDRTSRSVVIGPAKTNQLFVRNGGFVAGTVPEVLEYGGQVGIFEVFRYGRWQRADLRSRRRLAGLKTRVRTVTIKPRPYMGPAQEKNRDQLPRLWAAAMLKAA